MLQGQGSQVVWQGKNHMDVGCVEHLALPGGEPRGLGGTMAFGATTVPARVVRLDLVATVIALRDMAAEGRRATERNGPQGTVLHA